MQSLFKSRKKRDSHNKVDDGSSVASHEHDQRSPSGASTKSAESPLKSAQSALNGLKGTQAGAGIAGVVGSSSAAASSALGSASNGASNAVAGVTSHLPQGVQNSVQQQMHNVQNAGNKVLNSPFLGSGQQGQPQGQGQFAGQEQAQGYIHGQGRGQAPSQYPSGQYQQRSSQGPPIQGNQYVPNQMQNPQAHPHNYQGQQRLSQQPQHQQPQQGNYNGRSPGFQSPQQTGIPQGHPGSNASSPGTPIQGRGFRQQHGNDASYVSPLAQPSETPWAEYNIQRAAPSSRFGHSANYLAARDGELFIMGGIRDMDILNDLWVVDTNTLTGYQLVTDGHKVGPRVGHASLVLGNAHVVFGGDTKIQEADPLDNNLYLLNTSSLKWTVAQPQGPRPSGRYGHSLSNVGARVYVFGGQVDEEFYDDMWAFDLTNWRSPNARWERIQPTTPPPPPRTNHTVVTYKDKLYLFGGANGDLWYSDTWCFDPSTRAWEQLECSGYVPAPCQGHASTIIDDVMYVFGGMSSQGVLIDQLFALKLTTLKWYTFQNLGPGPSSRSGHSLTAFGGDKILVWGGTDEVNSAYVLDVSRINYPEDQSVTGTAAGTNQSESNAASTQSPLRSSADAPAEKQEASKDATGSDVAGVGIAGLGAAGAAAAGAAAAGGLASSQSDIPLSGSTRAEGSDSRKEPTSEQEGQKTSTGPITTKEVRELQPHVYAPQSTENSGPTQARSNSAARNSMLFSKRRSVLMPNSPIKEFKPSTDEKQELPAEPASLSETGDTRSPNRTSGQVKSYVTEGDGDFPDEKFVSATDLHYGGDSQKDPSRSRGHSRGLSFGTSAHTSLPEEEGRGDSREPSSENDQQFRKLEKELGGMPGGIPGSFPNDSSSTFESPAAASNNGGIVSDDSMKSGLSDWNKEAPEGLGVKPSYEENKSAGLSSGLRRSHPQTNLSLQTIDSTEDGDSESRQPVSHDLPSTGAAEAGIIGLSDQMSSLPTDSSSPAVTREVSTATSASDDVSPPHSAHTSSSAQPSTNAAAYPSSTGNAAAAGTADTLTRGVNGTDSGSSAPALQSNDFHALNRDASANSTASGIGAAAAGNASNASVSAELAQLRKAVDEYRQRDFDNEHHQLKQSHADLQRELANLKDSNGQLTRKHASITGHNTELKQRYDQLEKVMDEHVATLKSQQASLDEARAKIKSQQQELAELPSLKSENADLKMRLKTAESAQRHAEEQLAAINNSYSSLKSAHSDLSAKHLAATTGITTRDANAPADPHEELHSHVNHLVSLWEHFKLPASSRGQRGIDESAETEGPTGYRSLYETQKVAADQAQQQLQAAYKDQDSLKRQLRELSAAHSVSPSTADLDLLKEQHNSALSQINNQHQTTLADLHGTKSSLEDLRARLQKLETSHTELQSEYNKAVSLSRNQQVALTKTREELNMSRAHAQRLEEQLEDVSVQNSSLQGDRSSGAVEGDVSHTSVNSSRNDQATLVIRDLRAQVVILEEEMQNQREQIMRLKKAALTH